MGNKITTHCLRRSGAQILAFHQTSGAKWNLSLVRSYCGWTSASEREMMSRYLIHTAKELEDESLEAFNPFLSKRNIIIDSELFKTTFDQQVQQSVICAFKGMFDLKNDKDIKHFADIIKTWKK